MQIITSLESYIQYIESLPSDFNLSRGQQKRYPLFPSGLRHDMNGKKLYSRQQLKSFLEDFKIEAFHYITNANSVDNDMEWSIYAQHFGLPTQLLDFSYSHLVSLMFAIEDAFQYKENDSDERDLQENHSIVYFLSPSKLNHQTIGEERILNISFKGNESYLNGADICAICSKKNNERIIAQNGAFVYFPYGASSLESLESAEKFLRSVLVPHCEGRKILASLYRIGMRFDKLYPELASVSKDIKLKHNVQEYIWQGDTYE